MPEARVRNCSSAWRLPICARRRRRAGKGKVLKGWRGVRSVAGCVSAHEARAPPASPRAAQAASPAGPRLAARPPWCCSCAGPRSCLRIRWRAGRGSAARVGGHRTAAPAGQQPRRHSGAGSRWQRQPASSPLAAQRWPLTQGQVRVVHELLRQGAGGKAAGARGGGMAAVRPATARRARPASRRQRAAGLLVWMQCNAALELQSAGV